MARASPMQERVCQVRQTGNLAGERTRAGEEPGWREELQKQLKTENLCMYLWLEIFTF